MSEFSLIKRFFTRAPQHTDLGVGDDAALLRVGAGMQLAVSTDMLVCGTHFFANAAPYDVGWKALAVNVSDMAAMGAQAKWATLALALPNNIAIAPVASPSHLQGKDCDFAATQQHSVTSSPPLLQGEGWDGGQRLAVNATPTLALKEGGNGTAQATAEKTPDLNQTVNMTEAWLSEFARGFFACADAFDIDLIGGDTTRGPLNICVTIFGETPTGQALRRNGAQVGDDVWVSGYLGSAAAGLAHLQGNISLNGDALQASIDALHRPIPRIALGLKLRGIASACLDISDGLAQDLGHILAQSHVGADIFSAQLPIHPALSTALQANNSAALEYMLSGGDDYELCFTAPANKRTLIEKISTDLNLPLTRIGHTRTNAGLSVFDAQNNIMPLTKTGYDHFA